MRPLPPDLATLAGLAPFDRCGARDLAQLAPHVDRLRVATGTTLARSGQLVHQVVVVLDGEVSVYAGDDATRAGPGAVLGADDLAGDGVHRATLVAHTDVELLVVFGPAYRAARRAGELVAARSAA